MKVKLKNTTCFIHGGKRYKSGDELDVSDYVYNTHKTRFENVEKVVLNEPEKQAEEEATDKPKPKRTTRAKK
jgi:hypothetical protein